MASHDHPREMSSGGPPNHRRAQPVNYGFRPHLAGTREGTLRSPVPRTRRVRRRRKRIGSRWTSRNCTRVCHKRPLYTLHGYRSRFSTKRHSFHDTSCRSPEPTRCHRGGTPGTPSELRPAGVRTEPRHLAASRRPSSRPSLQVDPAEGPNHPSPHIQEGKRSRPHTGLFEFAAPPGSQPGPTPPRVFALRRVASSACHSRPRIDRPEPSYRAFPFRLGRRDSFGLPEPSPRSSSSNARERDRTSSRIVRPKVGSASASRAISSATRSMATLTEPTSVWPTRSSTILSNRARRRTDRD